MNPGNWYYRIHRHPIGRIFLHIMLWLFFYALQYYMLKISLGTEDWATAYIVPLKNTITTIIGFYLLVYIVWPWLWKKKKFLAAIFATIAVILVYAMADYALERLILTRCEICVETLKRNQPAYYRFLQNDSFGILVARILSLGIVYQLFLSLALPVGIKFTLEYFRQHLQTMQLKTENIQLELNLLKAQVNPHFLFNTLNNIYALILKDRKVESAETVARLSTFLRYTLYEAKGHSSSITKEINLLKDYIALEKIRLNRADVQFHYELDHIHYQLPPLLFMPVVENAFKFCVESKEVVSQIAMDLRLKNDWLTFRVSNTYDEQHMEHKVGGIGLENLVKRLQHYYPGRHSLDIRKDQAVFTILVEINLLHQ